MPLDHVKNVAVLGAMCVAPMVGKMHESRHRWYCHVMCSSDDSVVRKAMEINPEGRRPWEKLRGRWIVNGSPSWGYADEEEDKLFKEYEYTKYIHKSLDTFFLVLQIYCSARCWLYIPICIFKHFYYPNIMFFCIKLMKLKIDKKILKYSYKFRKIVSLCKKIWKRS